MKIGWARVSTKDQNLDLQMDALKKEGCKQIYSAKISSAKAEISELENALSHLREGDTLVVWKLNRLHRSMKKGLRYLYELKEKGVAIKSIVDGIDTTSKTGELIYLVVSWLAEWDRENIIENTKAGLAAAKARGKNGGRPKSLEGENLAMMIKLYNDPKIPIKAICDQFKITRRTLNRYVMQWKKDHAESVKNNPGASKSANLNAGK